MSGKIDARSILSEAIYREIEARNFYQRIADTITNEEGKKKFYQLSRDEESHRVKLSQWYRKLLSEEFELEGNRIGESEASFFKAKDSTSAMEALDIAIKAEAAAEEFYRNRAGEVEQEELKELLEELAEQEHGHYNLLLAERNALVGGFYWFDMDSSGFLED